MASLNATISSLQAKLDRANAEVERMTDEVYFAREAQQSAIDEVGRAFWTQY